MQYIYLYDFFSYFIATALPCLKSSLSSAIVDFIPLAVNILIPHHSRKPQSVYTDGDSLSLTVAESTMDFDRLLSSPLQDAAVVHPLVPHLPPSRVSEDGDFFAPIMDIQLTVFPNSGICIGLQFPHVAADGKSIQDFMKAWAAIHRSGADSNSKLKHVSKFVVACAFMWYYWIKTQDKSSEGDDTCRFLFLADCRSRLGYSIPTTYFGNCLSIKFVRIGRGLLIGKGGIGHAAEAIGNKAKEMEEDPLKGAKTWWDDISEFLKVGNFVTVAGSPRFGVYIRTSGGESSGSSIGFTSTTRKPSVCRTQGRGTMRSRLTWHWISSRWRDSFLYFHS